MADFSDPESAHRPEFLAILGLMPPVSVADVKQAYLDRVKTVHPDLGGDPQQFMRLHKAFEQATEYAQFKAGRMQWLSRWVEQYAEQEQIVGEIKSWGGTVDVEAVDGLAQTIGNDFATVLERVVAVRLSGPQIDDQIVLHLSTQRRLLAGLERLALVDTKITSVGIRQLHKFDSLRHLDLSGTRVSLPALEALLAALDRLESLNLRDTGIGWWARARLRWSHRRMKIAP